MDHQNTYATSPASGFFWSLLLTIVTTVTFGLAMMAIPPSGPNCPADCMVYPFGDLLRYYPRDYLWMMAAVIQLGILLMFFISNHFNAPESRKFHSFSALMFAAISVAVLLLDYWIQFSVVPISVMKNETEGIPLLTQYNGHGIFIAMEELGFILMSVAFGFLSTIYGKKSRLETALRWMYRTPVIVIVFALGFYSFRHGLDRHYRVEVAAISINWTVTIVAGILSCVHFKRPGKYLAEQC